MPRKGSTGARTSPMACGGMAAVGTAPWSSTQLNAARATSGQTAKVGPPTTTPWPAEHGCVETVKAGVGA